MRINILLFVFLFFGFSGGAIGADAPLRFLSVIPDIPVMEGLREMEEQAIVFDKAEGRIVEASASLEQQSRAEVLEYYAHVLPQLGWERLSADRYKREEEILNITFESLDGDDYVRFSIAP